MGGDGPRATPTWHDGRVYVLGGAGELRALDDSNGRTIWRTNILEDAGASNLQWGMAAAPLIVDDTVIVLPGGRAGQSVVAYNRSTGKRAWAALDDQASYSSPMLVTLGGVRQILVFTASRLAGITPDRGELLWEFPWTTQYEVNASQPLLLGPNRVFISTGYGSGAALIELARDGAGPFSVKELWRTNRMKNQFTSSVAARRLHLRAGRGDPRMPRRHYGAAEMEGRPLRLRSGPARGRPPDRPHRRRGPGPCACDARRALGTRPLSRSRGEDLEPPRHERRLPARPQRQRDGGVRPSA